MAHQILGAASPCTQKYFKILRKHRELYGYGAKPCVLEASSKSQIALLQKERKSGRKLQATPFPVKSGYENNDNIVACTQPRRVPVMSVDKGVTNEMDASLNAEMVTPFHF